MTRLDGRRGLRLAAPLLLVALELTPAVAQLEGPEFQINSHTFAPQSSPAAAVDDAGGFVVVWQGYGQDGSYSAVLGRRYSPEGIPAGGAFQVNTYTEHTQREPAVAMDGTGRFVVVWESYDQDGSTWGVFGQRFSPAGLKVGSEFQVNSYTTERQQYPAVAADGSGNFIGVWQSWDQSHDTPGHAVLGERVDAAGTRISEVAVIGGALYWSSMPLSGDVPIETEGTIKTCVPPRCGPSEVRTVAMHQHDPVGLAFDDASVFWVTTGAWGKTSGVGSLRKAPR